MKRHAPTSASENRPWTEDEDAVLIRLSRALLSNKEIMKSLPGRTYKGIEGRRRKLDLPKPPQKSSWRPEEIRILKKLARQGKSAQQISDALPGRGESAVTKKRKALGLPTMIDRNFWNSTRVSDLKRFYVEGVSFQEMASHLGCTVKTVHNKCRKLGLPFRYGTYDDPVTPTGPAIGDDYYQNAWKRNIAEGMEKFDRALAESGLQFEDSPRAIKADARRLRQSDFEHYVEKAA